VLRRGWRRSWRRNTPSGGRPENFREDLEDASAQWSSPSRRSQAERGASAARAAAEQALADLQAESTRARRSRGGRVGKSRARRGAAAREENAKADGRLGAGEGSGAQRLRRMRRKAMLARRTGETASQLVAEMKRARAEVAALQRARDEAQAARSSRRGSSRSAEEAGRLAEQHQPGRNARGRASRGANQERGEVARKTRSCGGAGGARAHGRDGHRDRDVAWPPVAEKGAALERSSCGWRRSTSGN